MTNLRDIIELDMLLENIYTWAVRIFKPYVATCIHQWAAHYPEEQMAEGSAPTEVGAASLQEEQRQRHRNSHSTVEKPAEIDTLSQASGSKLSTSEWEKLLEDTDKVVVRRVQELMQNVRLTLASPSPPHAKAAAEN